MVLGESGSGDHPFPHSEFFGNLTDSSDRLTVYASDTPVPYQSSPNPTRSRRPSFSGDWFGEWRYDRKGLRSDLANGKIHLKNRRHQQRFLDWMRDEQMIVFQDKKTGEKVYSPVCRRGNRQYAMKKARQRDLFLEAFRTKELDRQIGNNPNIRETCALLITVTFDKKKYTMEEAWGMLSSTEIASSDLKTGVLNNLTANLRDIFGPLCKITVKEAQEDGYPAPHLIVLLDNPTTVKLHRGKGGQSWRIFDPHTLRRIGKDPALRRLSRIRHIDAISMNPIWKYGFIDVQGVVKGCRFKNRKDAVSYAYKYLTKSLTDDHCRELEDLDSISECRTKSLRISLWGHLCNKSYGLRDITYGRKVKEFLSMLPAENMDGENTMESRWTFMRTIPSFVYEKIVMWNARKMLRPFRSRPETSDANPSPAF